jgi:hypothetical protein
VEFSRISLLVTIAKTETSRLLTPPRHVKSILNATRHCDASCKWLTSYSRAGFTSAAGRGDPGTYTWPGSTASMANRLLGDANEAGQRPRRVRGNQ